MFISKDVPNNLHSFKIVSQLSLIVLNSTRRIDKLVISTSIVALRAKTVLLQFIAARTLYHIFASASHFKDSMYFFIPLRSDRVSTLSLILK